MLICTVIFGLDSAHFKLIFAVLPLSNSLCALANRYIIHLWRRLGAVCCVQHCWDCWDKKVLLYQCNCTNLRKGMCKMSVYNFSELSFLPFFSSVKQPLYAVIKCILYVEYKQKIESQILPPRPSFYF